MLTTFRIGIALAGAALALLMISVGHPTQILWWALSTFVFTFVLSPVIAAYAIVSRTRKLELRWTMALLSIGYTAFAGCTFYAVFAEPDVTSGLAFFAVPAFGWFGLPAAIILAALVTWLRDRSAEEVHSVSNSSSGTRPIIVPADRAWDDFFDAPGVDLGEREQPLAQTREVFR